jgi:hypothetical protein
MNIEQLNTVRNGIRYLRELNTGELFESLIGNNDPETKIDVLAVKDLPYYYNRMLNQLEKEVEKPDFPFYPDLQRVDNEDFVLSQELSEFRDCLKQKNINRVVVKLKRLIYYQIVNGFWNEGLSIKKDDLISEEILKLKSESDVLLKVSERSHSESKALLKELNARTEEIQEATKEIDNTSKQAIRYEEQIKAALTQSKEKQSEIEGIINQLTTLNKEMLAERTAANEKFSAFETEINANRGNFESLYEEVNSKKSTFDERLKTLTDLIGLEVSVSLSGSFKTRATDIGKSVSRWLKAIFAISAVNLGIILFFYYNMSQPIDFWQRILGSALKAVPTLFLLYYSISQYNKERNFKEIYEFKSAVALTLMAYRDQLEKIENKEELILNSVKNIYTPPEVNLTKSDSQDVNSMIDILKLYKELLPDKLKKAVD